MSQAIVGMELGDIQGALGPREPVFRARQIYDAVYRQRMADFAGISNLPRALRARLAAEFPVGLPSVDRQYESSDGTIRYLLTLADGKTVETVWMPQRSVSGAPDEVAGRATICISSQVGCPVDCKFCLTALM